MEAFKTQEFDLNPEHYAAIYARKSIVKDNNSIVGQIQRAKEILKEKKLILYNIYIDDGISATMTEIQERKGLNQLIADVKQQKFKTIVVYKSDRLARNIEQAVQIRSLLNHYNVKVIYSSQKDFEIPQGPIGDFIQNIMLGIDQLEATIISKRIVAGKKSKRLRGEYSGGGYDLLGYYKDTSKYLSKYTPDKKDSKRIKKIFNNCARLSTSYTKDDFLKDAKDIFKDSNSSKINVNFINKIITNPVYAGLMKIEPETQLDEVIIMDESTNKIFVDFDHMKECSNVTPIIDTDTYCNAFLKWNAIYEKRCYVRHTYIFKGLLKCTCGEDIHTKRYRYTCPTKGCTSINKEILEKFILETVIQDFINTDSFKHRIQQYIKDKKKNLQANIEKYEEALKQNKQKEKDYIKALIEKSDEDTIQEKIDVLLKEDANLMNQINIDKKRLYRIQSIFNDEQKIEKIKKDLSKPLSFFLDPKNIKDTQKLMNLIIEKVIINAKRNNCKIQEVDYGN